jgi:hypothetical protein
MNAPSPSLLDPTPYEMHIVRGSTLPIVFTFKFDDGTLQDLTGSAFVMFIVWPGGRIESGCTVDVAEATVTYSPADADETRQIPPQGGRFELMHVLDGENWTEIMGPVFGLGGITEPL